MSGKPIFLCGRALRDIDEAVEYCLAEAGSVAALDLVDALEGVLRHISQEPTSCSHSYACELDTPSLRFQSTEKFPNLVFYLEKAVEAEAWRVLHGSRDIPAWVRFKASGLQERRGPVTQADEVIGRRTRRDGAVPRDCQRDSAAVVVETGLGGGRASRDGRDRHEHVVELASLGEQVQAALHVAVEAFDFDVVIEDVIPRNGVVGQVRWDDDLHRILPRLLARADLVGPVRVPAAQPEAEGHVRLT